MHLAQENITSDRIDAPLLREKGISLTVLRLDKIHPDVSGNKLFKLHYFVTECARKNIKTLITFGGAYSNHLVATAFLCKETGIQAIGIVRGEKPGKLSHTLQRCINLGMILRFISREAYKNTDKALIEILTQTFGETVVVPEGGHDHRGAAGASLIMDLPDTANATHICTPVGTATTLAGLLMKRKEGQRIIAVPVIKNMTDIYDRIAFLTGEKDGAGLEIFDGYHFGGYAKYNSELIDFINDFYTAYNIPLDFVYTGKMMFAIFDMIKKDHFKKGSNILCLHTGGLQGNDSLPPGTLIF